MATFISMIFGHVQRCNLGRSHVQEAKHKFGPVPTHYSLRLKFSKGETLVKAVKEKEKVK